MATRILFPFDMLEDNRQAYQKAMQIAVDLHGHILCFTSLDCELDDKMLDAVYMHLLSLWGLWQGEKHGWARQIEIHSENRLKQGDYLINLKDVIAEWSPNWLVTNASSTLLNKERLEEILPRSLKKTCALI